MTADELKKFCVDNAGVVALGKDKDGKDHKGRILAYTPSKSGGWIILEDVRLAKSNVPHPLPSIPYFEGKWFRVMSDCHLGVGCRADTVKVMGVKDISVPKTIMAEEVIVPTNTTPRKCGHVECHVDWCWMRYAGLA